MIFDTDNNLQFLKILVSFKWKRLQGLPTSCQRFMYQKLCRRNFIFSRKNRKQTRSNLSKLVSFCPLQLVNTYHPGKSQYSTALRVVNQCKNRCPDLLASDTSRVFLSPSGEIDGDDYINASWLMGEWHIFRYTTSLSHRIVITVQTTIKHANLANILRNVARVIDIRKMTRNG